MRQNECLPTASHLGFDGQLAEGHACPERNNASSASLANDAFHLIIPVVF